MINLSKLKEQALPLLVLSVFQIALNFNFPAFNGLGFVSMWMLTILLIFLYMILFSHAKYFRPIFDLSYIDAPQFYKDMFRLLWILIMHMAFLYVWYVDLYHMSTFMYKIWFVHYWLVLGLLYRAAYKE